METPTQRLAEAARDNVKVQQHHNSPLEQFRRKNLSPEEANWHKESAQRSQDHVAQVQAENTAMAKMNDVSGKKSPLSTPMTSVKSKRVSK